MRPVVEHADHVGVADRRQPVGDHDGRAVGQRGVERGLHRGLVLVVQAARGLVEDDDGGILEEQPGDGQPLLLPAGHPVAPLADDGVEPVGQLGDGLVDLRGPAGRLQLGRRGVGLGVAEVVADGLVEEVGILADDADGGAEGLAGQIAHVVAVDADRAARDVVEPRDERGQGRLARARRADDRDQLARLHRQLDVRQHDAVGVLPLGAGQRQRRDRHLVGRRVAERHVLELDPPLRAARGRWRSACRRWRPVRRGPRRPARS